MLFPIKKKPYLQIFPLHSLMSKTLQNSRHTTLDVVPFSRTLTTIYTYLHDTFLWEAVATWTIAFNNGMVCSDNIIKDSFVDAIYWEMIGISNSYIVDRLFKWKTEERWIMCEGLIEWMVTGLSFYYYVAFL